MRGEGLPKQGPLGRLASERLSPLDFFSPCGSHPCLLSLRFLFLVCGPLCGSVALLSFALLRLPCRQVLILGLRGCGLWAELKALRAQSQELEDAAGHRQLLLRELQAKQQRILHWRQLVVRGWAREEVAGPCGGPEGRLENWLRTGPKPSVVAHACGSSTLGG